MKLQDLFESSPKHAVAQYLKKHHDLLSDMYEWKDFKTIKVLVPDNSDYIMKKLKEIPLEKVHPVYNRKTQEITFVPNRRHARDVVK